ncbi:ferric reductase [Thalassiosira oceanica]|uniref:Ferric reductase n=1 Tax=Thalassiosira oceanica TaxID=159749 RepID=K0TLJ6_THAOC|nr:ferric reductase [Thalassiosira oceanica]|eukprot:EJK71912.1 ferric reductase [Thalassiosira oceanica]
MGFRGIPGFRRRTALSYPCTLRISARLERWREKQTCWLELFFPILSFVLKKLLMARDWFGRVLGQDNHRRLIILSTLALSPSVLYFLSGAKSALPLTSRINHVILANWFGFLGVLPVNLLLYTTARFSVFVRALNISEVTILRMHIYAGTVCLIGGIVHGIYYTAMWLQQSRSLESLFPLTWECWTSLLDEDGGRDAGCHRKFVNLTGVVSALTWLVLILTSLWKARDNVNAVTILHAHAVESWYKSLFQRGLQVTSFTEVPSSGGCIEMSFATASSETDLYESALKTIGRYTRLTVPAVSIKSHPFSVFTHPERCGDITVLFRPCGPFTREVARALSSYQDGECSTADPIKFTSSGLHMGTAHQFEDAMSHENNVIFAGGVGIVSYVSLLLAVHTKGQARDQSDSSQQERKTKIFVHWICREEGLIAHVLSKHLRSICQDLSSRVSITVHYTGSREGTNASNPNSDSVQLGSPSRAFTESMYDNSSRTMSAAIVPILTQGVIMFGGMWLLQRNPGSRSLLKYPVAMLQVFSTSLLVSAAFIGLSRFAGIISLRCCKKYASLDTSEPKEQDVCESDHTSPISESESWSEEEGDSTLNLNISRSGNMDEGDVEVQTYGSTDAAFANVTHKTGRPNMGSILTQVMDDSVSKDVGVFFCGPSAMMNGVYSSANGIRKDNGKTKHCLPVQGSGRISLYPEAFEM